MPLRVNESHPSRFSQLISYSQTREHPLLNSSVNESLATPRTIDRVRAVFLGGALSDHLNIQM
jgi:hypothetical protein